MQPKSKAKLSASIKNKGTNMKNEFGLESKPEAILRMALPLYGGTTPVATVPAATTPPAEGDGAATEEKKTTETAGGSSPDALAKLAQDPAALGQLLSQVDTLQKALDKANTVVQAVEKEKTEAERAKQTREQQLESDLQQRDAIIQQMDAVIKNQAIAQAMMSVEGIQWNSVKQAVAELQGEEFDIVVDLEKGVATAEGIQDAAKRIAKDFPWLVKAAATPDPTAAITGTKVSRPSSGNPPKPPGNPVNEQKALKRKRHISRYSVLNGR